MGTLIYGGVATGSSIDDRALAHMQVVMLNKLRRRENFAYSWKNSVADGDGRSTIWIASEIPLQFKYSGSRPPTINSAWVEILMATANTAAGLHLLAEPASTD
jgi:hypothetical protein